MPTGWFDNRTILTCNLLVTVNFWVVLLGIRRAYPRLRGTYEIALAFLFCVAGGLFQAARGPIPYALSVIFGNSFLFFFHLFCYRGIAKFLAIRGAPRLALAVTLLSTLAILYLTLVHDRIVDRIVIIGLSAGILRLLMAIALYRHAPHRIVYRAFAAFMLLYSLIGFLRGFLTALYGTPSDFLQASRIQTTDILSYTVYLCCIGIFFLAMFGGELTEIVERRSQLDPLTGVLNRQGINLRFAAELERAARNRRPLSVLLIDIDHFKAINDTHGHLAGDEALLDVTRTILAAIRAYDLLGRFGGDEFIVLLPETGAARALEIAERMRSTPSFSLSIGIAEATADDNLTSLFNRADEALYDAKRDGRNCTRTRLP